MSFDDTPDRERVKQRMPQVFPRRAAIADALLPQNDGAIRPIKAVARERDRLDRGLGTDPGITVELE